MSKARQNPASRARGATVWTPERVKAVCERHATGVFLKHACALEGASQEGLRDAAARDPEIAAAVERAHADGVDLLRARMNEAGAEEDDQGRKIRYGDWKREAWLLERFDREAFAPPKNVVESKGELSGPGGVPLVPAPARTPAEARTELQRLLTIADETMADLATIRGEKR